ncbi:MAG: 6-phosphogluconolactonase [Phycisphaerales bacterium]|nr:6-phosphogluconolactonase [Phycisphaerales bacterium]MDP7087904.1 6-phosphogluconolactonase [Phycisphaerales bacterium]
MTPLPGSRVLDDGMTIEVLPDADAIALRGAGWIAGTLVHAVASRKRCVLAISGGCSPWPMFRRLVMDSSVPWERVHIMQVDERIAPDGDVDRNWTQAARVFGGVVPDGNLHPMPVGDEDLESACDRYAALLEKLTSGDGLCIAHLGLGPDGHTASLFPCDLILEVQDRSVALTSHEHAGRRRMSLTYRVLAHARHLLWQVQGAGKMAMLSRLIEGDGSIPAARVRRDTSLVLADAAAMGGAD